MRLTVIMIALLSFIVSNAQTRAYFEHLKLKENNTDFINSFLNARIGQLQGNPVPSLAQKCFHKDKKGNNYTHNNYVYIYCVRLKDGKEHKYYKKILGYKNSQGKYTVLRIGSKELEKMNESISGQRDTADLSNSFSYRINTKQEMIQKESSTSKESHKNLNHNSIGN